MKGKGLKIVVFLIYCVPFPFLAAWGDAMHGTMLLYGLMITAYFFMGMLCRKTKNELLMIIGGITGGALSLAAGKFTGLQTMDHYFKPFTALSLIAVLSACEFVINSLIAVNGMRRSQHY